MIGGLYGLAGRLAAPALRRMLARRVLAGKDVPARLNERYGIAGLPRPAGRLVWFHAASVGETLSILPVIAALAGEAEVLLTTGTVTSARLAAERLPEFARHQFVPLDVSGWVAQFLDHWRPDCAVFVESELWPNMLMQADARGIPRLLLNARLSARSAKRWARVPGFAWRMLGPFRYVHAQSAADAEHLASLGISDVRVWGNLKYFGPLLPADPAMLAALRRDLAGPHWLAASTHEGEETLVVSVHRRLLEAFPDLVTIIVPRHPERGAAVAALAVDVPVTRLSAGQAPVPGGVFVADTLGQLGLFYRACPFAFVGNSLLGFGGHNVVEPARLGRAVIVGPHVENFAEPVARLRAAGGLKEVADAGELAAAVQAWLRDPAAAAKAGDAARGAFLDADKLPERLAGLILASAL
jgi:3-deoxy-D-manno-octulosonic-acid transferase